MISDRLLVPVALLALSAGVRCAGHGETAAATSSNLAAATDPSLVCLPKASCGCFGGECVAGRIERGADGTERFLVEGQPLGGLPGVVTEVCPNAANGLVECVKYVDLAQTCTVVCSSPPDHFSDPGYRCGFQDGGCGKL